jgi:hypothetical protein
MKVHLRLIKASGVLLVVAIVCGIAAVTLWQQDQPSSAAPPGSSPTLQPVEYFQDVTTGSGLAFTYHNGEEADHCTILESLGGGVALLDFDGDGLLDIFVTGGGRFTGAGGATIEGLPCGLYKNLGNWKFQDVTESAGLRRNWFYTHGCAVGDYDCDGWPDLLVTGYGHLALYHNENDLHGGRHFVDVTAKSGLDVLQWPTSAGWADLDGDGYPDLYICQYVDWSWKTHHTCQGDAKQILRDVCAPEEFQALPHRLFRNNHDGTFTDVSKEAGLRSGPRDFGKGLGVILVDLNDDHRPDIYAVNDSVVNLLYINDSSPGHFHFIDCGAIAGVATGDSGKPDGSMGVDAADYNGAGLPSLLVTTFQGELPALYRNDSTRAGQAVDKVLFRYATQPAGLAALGTAYVGFGAAFLDLDLDGWEDLVMVNGHVRRFPTTCPYRQFPILMHNQANGQFADWTTQGGEYFRTTHLARGLAIGDLDNDGRPDLAISHQNRPITLLRNAPEGRATDGESRRVGSNHWVGLELHGRNHRDIAGAKIVVDVAGRRLTRFAKGGGSYLSSSDRRLLVGLASTERVDAVTVFWPWGRKESWSAPAVDRYMKLNEGEGTKDKGQD